MMSLRGKFLTSLSVAIFLSGTGIACAEDFTPVYSDYTTSAGQTEANYLLQLQNQMKAMLPAHDGEYINAQSYLSQYGTSDSGLSWLTGDAYSGDGSSSYYTTCLTVDGHCEKVISLEELSNVHESEEVLLKKMIDNAHYIASTDTKASSFNYVSANDLIPVDTADLGMTYATVADTASTVVSSSQIDALGSLQSQMSTLESTFQQQYASAKANGLDTSALVQAYETQKANLSGQISGLQTQLTGQLSGSISSAATSTINGLQTQLSGYTSQLTSLDANFATGLEDMKAKVASGLATTTDLNNYVNAYSSAKANLQGQISGIQNKITSEIKTAATGAVSNVTGQVTGAINTAATNAVNQATSSLGFNLSGPCGYVSEGGMTACGQISLGALLGKLKAIATNAATNAANSAVSSAAGSISF